MDNRDATQTARRRLLLGVLSLGGCAGQAPTRSGFLSSYDRMAPTPDRTHDLIFVSDHYRIRAYSRIFIESVAWHPAQGSPARTPEEIAELCEALRTRLVTELSKNFAIVETTNGPADLRAGTLCVRAAITNTRRANWWINMPVQAAGVGLALSGIPGGVPPPNPGGASIEIEVLDAVSSQRLVAIATYTNGAPWAATGYIMRFGHARRAFDLAAGLLREQLVQSS